MLSREKGIWVRERNSILVGREDSFLQSWRLVKRRWIKHMLYIRRLSALARLSQGHFKNTTDIRCSAPGCVYPVRVFSPTVERCA